MLENDRLDLLLVNPGGRTRTCQSLGSTLAAIEPPVWAGLMATFARRKGLSVQVLDCNAENLSPEEASLQIVELNPLLTAVVAYGHQPSASTQTMPAASAICAELKQAGPKLKTLLVGGHVAALPDRTLREEKAEFVCRGEGPQTVIGLAHALRSSLPTYSKVPDLSYWEDGVIQFTPPAPLITDLDNEMPELAWDLLPMDKYRAHNWHCFDGLQREPYAAVYTTLGCPYHCEFCCIQAPFKGGEAALGYKGEVNSYRFWSPEVVVGQIDRLVHDYNVRNIKFADEMFVLNQRHVNEICDLIIERGYDLNIWAYARVDTVKEQMLDKLRRAGVTWLAFGVEAASERVRIDVQKGFNQGDVYKTINAVQNAGIYVGANYIFGLPEDDMETMQATLDMALELNTEWVNFYCTMAYPGSLLYKKALEEGWPLPEDWSGYSQHSVDTLPLPTQHSSATDVLQFRDHAFQTYFSSPHYLSMIERKFGKATRQHIVEMASHKLERKYV